MTPIVVLTTVAAAHDARAIGRELVQKRVAACVNIVDRVVSIYRWQGTIEEDGEQLLVMKTTRERVDALREVLFAVHPYEVPEFVVLPIERIDDRYREWLEGEVNI